MRVCKPCPGPRSPADRHCREQATLHGLGQQGLVLKPVSTRLGAQGEESFFQQLLPPGPRLPPTAHRTQPSWGTVLPGLDAKALGSRNCADGSLSRRAPRGNWQLARSACLGRHPGARQAGVRVQMGRWAAAVFSLLRWHVKSQLLSATSLGLHGLLKPPAPWLGLVSTLAPPPRSQRYPAASFYLWSCHSAQVGPEQTQVPLSLRRNCLPGGHPCWAHGAVTPCRDWHRWDKAGAALHGAHSCTGCRHLCCSTAETGACCRKRLVPWLGAGLDREALEGCHRPGTRQHAETATEQSCQRNTQPGCTQKGRTSPGASLHSSGEGKESKEHSEAPHLTGTHTPRTVRKDLAPGKACRHRAAHSSWSSQEWASCPCRILWSKGQAIGALGLPSSTPMGTSVSGHPQPSWDSRMARQGSASSPQVTRWMRERCSSPDFQTLPDSARDI